MTGLAAQCNISTSFEILALGNREFVGTLALLTDVALHLAGDHARMTRPTELGIGSQLASIGKHSLAHSTLVTLLASEDTGVLPSRYCRRPELATRLRSTTHRAQQLFAHCIALDA